MVQRFRERARDLLGDRLLEVKIFGSQARGQRREESDLDLFVMVEGLDRSDRRALYDLATDLNLEYDFQEYLAPLVMSRAEFEHLCQRERRLALDILAEGIPI